MAGRNTKKIVTVQDISCYGQCSTTIAQPILSAYGVETAILPSAILSTHTAGFGNFTVLDLTDEMPRIINHWKEEKITFDAVYTGYIGDARQFDMIRDMREMLNEGGEMIVDPAMADHGKLYPALNEDIVAGMRKLVQSADLILPNLTEAAFLLEEEYREYYTEDEVKEMLKKLCQMGPKISILTGVSFEEGRIGAASYNKETGEYVVYLTTKKEKSYHGTGDAFSAVAIAAYLNGKPMAEVLEEACEFIVKAIEETLPDENHFYGVKFEQVLLKK